MPFHFQSYALFQHATRVLRILELQDHIDGLVYCDYASADFTCKPQKAFFDMVIIAPSDHSLRHGLT